MPRDDAADASEPPARRFLLLPRNRYLGWTPYAWLIYLPSLFIAPLATHASLGEWLATLVAAVAFLVSYFRGYWLSGTRLVPIVLFQTGLGVGLIWTNPGAAVFFIYAASFGAQLDRTSHAVRAILGVSAVGLAASVWAHAPGYTWVMVGVFAPIIGGVNLHFAQVGRTSRRLRLAQGEIARLATVAERERIARDLHDVLGHTLSLITLKSELAAKLAVRDPERAAREMRDVEEVSRKALQDVRAAIRGYRATLPEEIERSRSLLHAADMTPTVDVRLDASRPALGADVEEALAFALREGVTNVVRHAGAVRCRIEVRESDDAVHLVLEDDGRARGPVVEGNGLRGMRARVETLDGTVTVHRTAGTRLTVTIPTPARPAAPVERVAAGEPAGASA